jgi:uncharacterized protein YbjT (DUF2867 family)
MILVTGGTGFIGQALIRQLVASGRSVRILLRPSPGSPRLPVGIPVEVAVCSLNDERGLRASMKNVDTIFHLAGTERHGGRADLMGVDVEGTQAVAHSASQAGVDRLFFLSHLGADRFSGYPVLKAKALAENLIIQSGVNYTIFRTASVFGPGDQFSVPLAQILKLSPLIFLMPGNGSTVLQPLWIEDLVTCLDWAIDEPKTAGQTFSIGGAETLTFLQILELVQSALHIKRFIVPVTPAYLRIIAVIMEHSFPKFPISLFWLDYLASDRTCAIDALPRLMNLMPARFHQKMDYLHDLFKK